MELLAPWSLAGLVLVPAVLLWGLLAPRGRPVGLGVGGGLGKSRSLPFTLLVEITPARTQPTATTMIIKMINGNQYLRTLSE